MAPWSKGLLSPSSRNDPGPSSPSASSPSQPRGWAARVTEADMLENAYGIPTLRRSQSPSKHHGRSMSHPFPSLFSGRKKKQGNTVGGEGFDSTDDEEVSPVLARNTVLNSTAKQTRVPDKDLMTGKCMTCDSMVRWPKDLKVFRCTVCLTINDLKPVALEARRGDGQRTSVVRAGSYPGPAFSTNGMSLNISYGDLKLIPSSCAAICRKNEGDH